MLFLALRIHLSIKQEAMGAFLTPKLFISMEIFWFNNCDQNLTEYSGHYVPKLKMLTKVYDLWINLSIH